MLSLSKHDYSMQRLSVYILRCADGSFYTGVSNNLPKRLAEHNAGLDTMAYTRSRLPVKLVFVQEFDSPLKAIEMEKRIKKWRREKKIALIEGRLYDLPELSKSKRHPSTGSRGERPKTVTG